MLDIKVLEGNGFNTDQISQMVKIKEETVLDNIEKIPNYVPCDKLRQLKKDLNDSKFNPMQESMLHAGLDKNIDITIYANPKYSAKKMEIILNALIDNLNIIQFLDEYNVENGNDYIEDLELIFEGLKNHLDVYKYSSIKFNYEQKVQIKKGLESKLNVDKYAKETFNADQMSVLFKALRAGIDIEKMADEKYSYEAMDIIFANLKKGYNILDYITSDYSIDQIYQISKGLDRGVDVSKYSSINYSPTKMRAIRKVLEYNKNNSDKLSYEIYLKDISDEEIDNIRSILKNGSEEDKNNLYEKYDIAI